MTQLYRTQQIHIKRGHRLFEYFNQMTYSAVNLTNISNYYIRQIFTGMKKMPCDRFENEAEALEFINGNIDPLNEKRYKKYLKKKLKGSVKGEYFEFEKLKEGSFLNYELLEGIFKITDQVDYRKLPGQVNQQVMKLVFKNWKSFFASIKDYKINPEKYKGKPNIPKYKRKKSQMTLTLTNQVCKLKDGKYLRFPKTKELLNIGKYMSHVGDLKEVRIIPKKGIIVLEVVFSIEGETAKRNSDNYASIDLGVNNLVTMINNMGRNPLIIKGKAVKSMNQFYNKERAKYYSILRKVKGPEEGPFTSKRLKRLDMKRHLKIKDYFHKVSYHIVKYCVQLDIGNIVIGKNPDFKEDVQMRKADKQNFKHLPFSTLIQMITYKAQAQGITVIIQEESYSSKASFIDNDEIPIYGEEDEDKVHVFSGKRITRGRYKSKNGLIVNADVNAAFNILKKAAPEALLEIRSRGVEAIRACMSTPLVFKIA